MKEIKNKFKELSSRRRISCSFPGFTCDIEGIWDSGDVPNVEDCFLSSVKFQILEVEKIFCGPKLDRNNLKGNSFFSQYVECNAFETPEFQLYVKEVKDFLDSLVTEEENEYFSEIVV
jgi:hypothetical protein